MKELYKALADFQQGIKPIYKGTEGYGYKYADWGQILEMINPVMAMHKLGFTQLIDGTSLKTVVFHTESGESIESVAAIPQGVQLKGMNDFQVLGSAITYMRRYALSVALGLVTDKDADAAGEQVKTPAKVANVKEDTQEAILSNLLRQHGHTEKEDIQDFLQSEFGIKVVNGKADLTKEDVKFIIEALDTKGQ